MTTYCTTATTTPTSAARIEKLERAVLVFRYIKFASQVKAGAGLDNRSRNTNLKTGSKQTTKVSTLECNCFFEQLNEIVNWS